MWRNSGKCISDARKCIAREKKEEEDDEREASTTFAKGAQVHVMMGVAGLDANVVMEDDVRSTTSSLSMR